MSFYRKYELERMVQKAEPKTFRAREVAGGRAVFLHLLAGLDAVSRTNLMERVRALAEAGNPDIIEVDDNEFAPYIATGVLEGFSGLPAWVDRVSPSSPGPVNAADQPQPVAPAREPVPPPTAEPGAEAGEFTVRFASAETFRPRPNAASQKPPAGPVRTPQPGPQTAPPPVPPPASVMPSAAAPAAANEPGEFTRMFSGTGGQSAPPPRPAGPPLSAPPAARPAAPAPAARPAAPAPAAPPPAPHSQAQAQGGSEFSKLFGQPPASAPMPPAGGDEPGEFSRLFGAPPVAPSDNPAGFAPAQVVKPRAADAPLPWEPQSAPPLPEPPKPARAQPAAPPRPVVETPDTQRMQAYVPPPPPAPAPPPLDQSADMWNSPPAVSPQQPHPGHSGPGEFTRFFASPMASSSLPIEDIEQGRMAEAMPPADKPFEGPGEFTRWFGKSHSGGADAPGGTGEQVPPPPPPAQYQTFSGRATGLFARPNIPPPPGERKGPSEFTRIMAAQPGQAEAEPAAYVPGAQPGRGPLIAVIVVIAVVLVLLVVTVILTMRR